METNLRRGRDCQLAPGPRFSSRREFKGESTVNEINEIRRQMAQIRHDLHQDVSNVVSGVSEVVNEVSGVMDWRSALRGHPYMLVGTALAAGYLIVPRRKKVAEPGQNSLASMVVPESLTQKKRFRPVS